MNADGAPGAFQPTRIQRLVLTAALSEEPGAAKSAYGLWRDAVDLDGFLDPGTFRLLPLLRSNLARHGVEDDFSGRLRGVFRKSWAESRLHIHRAEEILSVLGEHGVPTMVTKGLGHMLVHYGSPAERPMSDLDMVTPQNSLREAVSILEAHGWAANQGHVVGEFSIQKAVTLVNADGKELDLHWRVMNRFAYDRVEQGFWAAARPLSVGAATTLRPAGGDMLLHALLHGMRWNIEPPIRWIADAVMILRSGDPVDWDRLWTTARQLRQDYRLGLGLSMLRDDYGAQVPAFPRRTIFRGAALGQRIESYVFAKDPREATGPVARLARHTAELMRLLPSDDRKQWLAYYGRRAAAKLRSRLRPLLASRRAL